MGYTREAEADLEYLRMKAACANGRQLGKTLANIALLEDAILIYRLRHKLQQEDKYPIPQSLLVQTFMRKFQDDMDRRRP